MFKIMVKEIFYHFILKYCLSKLMNEHISQHIHIGNMQKIAVTYFVHFLLS